MTKDIVNNKIVAYFDFDGTLTTRDTLIPFLIYAIGFKKFICIIPLLIPSIILYLCKIIDNEELKQRTLRMTIRGLSTQHLEELAKKFAKFKLNAHLEPEIYAKMEWHIEQGHQIYIVSANLALYLKYWVEQHKLSGIIATEIEFVDGKCTGNLATRNCYATQKPLRVEQYLQYNQISYDYSYGYGNSRGDYELLDMVDEGFFVTGDTITAWEKSSEC